MDDLLPGVLRLGLRGSPLGPLTNAPSQSTLIARRYRIMGRRWRGLASTRLLALDTKDGGVPVEVVLLPGKSVCGDALRLTAAARSFVHPATPRMRSILLGERACVMVLDVTPGESVVGRLQRGDAFSAREVVVVATVLLSVLQAAHRLEIYDSDLSHEALRHSDGGEVCWAGLGLGWLLREETRRRGYGTSLWGYQTPSRFS
ncbi:MAG: hypothetical protein AAFV53_07680, partial [Myxococcota bacterium]